MEYLIIAAVCGPLFGLIYGNWKVHREIRRAKAETLTSLRAGCTRRAELAEFYSRKKPPTTCQCAAILGIQVTTEDCPITSN